MRTTFETFKANFSKLRPIAKVFYMTNLLTGLLSVYSLLRLYLKSLCGLSFYLLTLFLVYLYIVKYFKTDNYKYQEITQLILLCVNGFHLPAYYLGITLIAFYGEKNDETFLKMDEFFLGIFFPKGQIALALDNNNFLGPHTKLGKIMNNFLMFFYFLYFIIPYIVMFFLCFTDVCKEFIYRLYKKGKKNITYIKNWDDTYFVFSTYSFSYSTVLLINSLFPGQSPRLYLQDVYERPLEFQGLGKFLHQICRDPMSANTFPSGHVSETLSVSLALIWCGRKFEGYISLACSIIIMLATLILRYHYFVDVLCAIFLAVTGLLISYYYGYKKAMICGHRAEFEGDIELKEENDKEIINSSRNLIETKQQETFEHLKSQESDSNIVRSNVINEEKDISQNNNEKGREDNLIEKEGEEENKNEERENHSEEILIPVGQKEEKEEPFEGISVPVVQSENKEEDD